MASKVRIEHDGHTYEWTGKTWHDVATHMAPPRVVLQVLNQKSETALAEEDQAVTKLQKLLDRAKAARDAEQFQRAEKLLRRVLAIRPGHPGALAIYTSLLRRRGAPEEALKVSDPYRHLRYQPLLVSRAAALCDLERWEEAKKENGRALALGPDAAAFTIVNRIKANRPDLYE